MSRLRPCRLREMSGSRVENVRERASSSMSFPGILISLTVKKKKKKRKKKENENKNKNKKQRQTTTTTTTITTKNTKF